MKSKVFARHYFGKLVLGLFACGVLFFVPGLRAEDADGAQAARAVRLSSVDGTVHLFQGDHALTDQAVANIPLFEGTRIDAGDDGRAEIQFEDGSVARVSPQSSLTLTFLRGIGEGSNRDAEIQVNSGLAYFELQGDTESNQIRVRFGETVVTTTGFTVVRINLDKAPGEVAVFSGNAHLEGGATPAIDLHGGESVALNANEPNEYNLVESIEPDSWDAWNSDRDQELTQASADRTDATNSLPDSNNPAWGDLDANGNWYNVPGEGYVWSPNEATSADWDPYGNGYWMNTPSYGYTWVSGYPWGYLPYQCGAWNYYNSFGWGWAPGVCSPWWGGYGGWVYNIGYAPPRYHCPVRPHNPRPMDGRPGSPRPLIAVNRPPSGNVMMAPQDRTGTVMIAGNRVTALKPVQQPRTPYSNQPVLAYPTRSGPATLPSGRTASGFESGFAPHPVGTPATGRGTTSVWPSGSQPGSPTYSGSRPVPIRPSAPVYTPPSRPSVGSPAPPVRTYTPPPRSYSPPPAPVRSAPAPAPAPHPSGGGAAPRSPR